MKPNGHELWVGRTILSALVIFTVAPFVAMLSTALQPAGSSPAGLSVPNPPHFENFKSAFELAEMPTLLWSSTLLVVMVVPIAVVFASLAAYGMVIVRAPAAPLAFAVLLIGLTIPFEGLITPLYYQIRDLDGTPLTMAEGKRIVAEHHQVPKKKAKARYYRATNHKADRELQESQSAPTSRPAKHQPKPPQAA